MTNKYAVAGPNSTCKASGAAPAGFWAGVWHGMIMPITFQFSLRNPGVRIYETHNAGKRYDFGFLLGASMAFSGSSGSPHRHVNQKARAE
jgi:hypothetical protein